MRPIKFLTLSNPIQYTYFYFAEQNHNQLKITRVFQIEAINEFFSGREWCQNVYFVATPTLIRLHPDISVFMFFSRRSGLHHSRSSLYD